MSLIILSDVYKSYDLGETEITVLEGVNLVIEQGEFVAISGPSGSGKSTLCNLLGLLDTPTAGSVRFQGKEVTELSDDQSSELRNKAIGIVFQNFNLIPVLSAFENVKLPLEVMGVAQAVAANDVRNRLSQVGLEPYASQRPHKLSGGQQQRVAIARALVTNPSLVIADEPTANLDSETAIQIIDLMRQLNQDSGTTFIVATHDERLLTRVERIIVLRDGAIVEDKKSSCC